MLDVADAIGSEYEPHQPQYEITERHRRNDEDPNPDAQVDFLVEEVDGQNALHSVSVHIPHGAHLKVAHGAFGEYPISRALGSQYEAFEDTDSVDMKVVRYKHVKNEYLQHGIT